MKTLKAILAILLWVCFIANVLFEAHDEAIICLLLIGLIELEKITDALEAKNVHD
jgi:hypothetical protein